MNEYLRLHPVFLTYNLNQVLKTPTQEPINTKIKLVSFNVPQICILFSYSSE